MDAVAAISDRAPSHCSYCPNAGATRSNPFPVANTRCTFDTEIGMRVRLCWDTLTEGYNYFAFEPDR